MKLRRHSGMSNQTLGQLKFTSARSFTSRVPLLSFHSTPLPRLALRTNTVGGRPADPIRCGVRQADRWYPLEPKTNESPVVGELRLMTYYRPVLSHSHAWAPSLDMC